MRPYAHTTRRELMARAKGSQGAAAQARYALFVEAYIANGQNATQAAIQAGYSPKTSGQMGHALLKNPQIVAAVEKRRAELQSVAALTAEEVIKSLARAVRFDPGKLYYPQGHPKAGALKPIFELDDDTRLELEGFDVDSIIKLVRKQKKDAKGKLTTEIEPVIVPRVKYDLPKKATARDQAMKHFGLYAKDKQGYNPDDSGPPPAPIAVSINFKDARRNKAPGSDTQGD